MERNKNIHVLPTENSSKLSYNKDGVLELHRLQWKKNTQNIYITSDDEIKVGDWMIRDNEQPTLVTPNFFWDFGVRYYKIILTTDQSLDGVQAIDDEFLQWFVKNPSCEFVEVESFINGNVQRIYEIIIPREYESECICETECRGFVNVKCKKPKQENCCTPIGQIKRYVDCKGCDRKPKQIDISKYTIGIDPYDTQETIEEIADIMSTNTEKVHPADSYIYKQGILDGYNLAQQQNKNLYSEEEVLEILYKHTEDLLSGKKLTLEKWFEQFKKK